jgi:hypothetical protein
MTEPETPSGPILIPANGTAIEGTLAERVERLEDAMARLQAGPNSATFEEQLSERVLKLFKEKAAQQRVPTTVGVMSAVPQLGSGPPAGTINLPTEQSLWSWLMVGVLGELKLILRMYLDPRYRLSRLTQFGAPGVLLGIVGNYFFFNYSCLLPIPFLPQIVERGVIVILAYVLVKILSREAGRYRQVLDYLSRYGYT